MAQRLADQYATLTANRGTMGIAAYQVAVKQLKAQIDANILYEKEACAAAPPAQYKGSIKPFYEILALLYAPPGYAVPGGPTATQPGQVSPCTVDYGSESKTGTTTSSAKSFKDSNSVSATITSSFFGSGTSLGFGVEESEAKQDSSAIQTTKDAKSDIKVSGPPTDGIDHDYDVIWLALNPVVDFSTPLHPGAVSWSLSYSGNILEQYVYVKWLKEWIADPSAIDSNPVGSQLKKRGFTVSDFKSILSVDPFVNGTPDLNSPRFTELSLTFPYEPQVENAQSPPLQTYSISNESMTATSSSDTHESQQTITVGATAAGPGVSVAMSFQNQMTWSWETSQAQSADGTQSASLTIGTPSADYKTPLTTMAVYWDNIWSSWVFVPISLDDAFVSGTLLDGSGKPLAHHLVTLTAKGVSMRTYSGLSGHYSFPSHALHQGQRVVVGVGPSKQTFSIGPSLKHLILHAI